MWRLKGYTLRHNLIIITSSTSSPYRIPYSVFIITIISQHPKEEPEHTDKHVELHGIISHWILLCTVCCNRYVFMFSIMFKQNGSNRYK
ncbi:hypothetical protein HanIR_Chr01g0004731 [Helianthus annuus]|nr:hypothetical protein HanIR_Chr01g0004731 [Helianthus annuus]